MSGDLLKSDLKFLQALQVSTANRLADVQIEYEKLKAEHGEMAQKCQTQKHELALRDEEARQKKKRHFVSCTISKKENLRRLVLKLGLSALAAMTFSKESQVMRCCVTWWSLSVSLSHTELYKGH